MQTNCFPGYSSVEAIVFRASAAIINHFSRNHTILIRSTIFLLAGKKTRV